MKFKRRREGKTDYYARKRLTVQVCVLFLCKAYVTNCYFVLNFTNLLYPLGQE